MRRIGWTGCVLVIGCLTPLLPAPGADDPPRVEKRGAEDVDRILGEWQKRMSSVTSIEAKFRKKTTPKVWYERKSIGRIVLAAPNLAMVETTTVEEEGKPTSKKWKSIWNGQHLLTFDYEDQKVIQLRRPGDRSSVPEPLRVSFFFQMSTGRARDLFDWKFLGERGDRVYLVATSKDAASLVNQGPPIYTIELEKESWLPRRVFVEARDRERETYEWHDVKLNAPVEEDLKDPCLDAWEVVEPFGWLTRWLAQ